MPPRLEKLIEERRAATDEMMRELLDHSKTENPHKVLNETTKETALAAWNAALEAVKEGVPPERVGLEEIKDPEVDYYITCRECGGYDECDCEGFNKCRTAVTDHINSLGV
jgi:hypothetical protein